MSARLDVTALGRRLAGGVRAAVTGIVLALLVQPLMAGPQAAYRNDPTHLSTDPSMRSQFGLCKPLLVDDFVTAHAGYLHAIDWYGSQSADARFMVALFDHEPVGMPGLCEWPDPTLSHQLYAEAFFVTDSVAFVIEETAPNLQGVFRYGIGWPDGPFLASGTRYWLSVASFEPDWYWAQAQGEAAVGEKQDGARALCLDGQLPCEQWADVGADLAFFIMVPEPGTLALLGLAGLAALALPRAGRGGSVASPGSR